MREMLVSWKKNEKEERDWRKRQHKEDLDRQRVEEEKREAARQARKLEFLISQTELYSHFVGSKLKSAFYSLVLIDSGADSGHVQLPRLREMVPRKETCRLVLILLTVRWTHSRTLISTKVRPFRHV
jgi:hypothetical protein